MTSRSKKVCFFTFSTRALLQHLDIVSEIISILEKKCNLTLKFRWFDNPLHETSEQIYKDSLKAILQAHVFIADVTITSTGVGQQIAYAIQHKKPTIILMHEKLKKKPSALFLKGTQSSFVSFVYYKTIKDLEPKLIKSIESFTHVKLEKFNFLATNKVKTILQRESQKQQISMSELLRRVVEEWAQKGKLTL